MYTCTLLHLSSGFSEIHFSVNTRLILGIIEIKVHLFSAIMTIILSVQV